MFASRLIRKESRTEAEKEDESGRVGACGEGF